MREGSDVEGRFASNFDAVLAWVRIPGNAD